MKHSETAPIFGWNEKRWLFSWNVMNCDHEDEYSPLYILFVSFCSRPSLPALTKTNPQNTTKVQKVRVAASCLLPQMGLNSSKRRGVEFHTAEVWSQPAARGGVSLRFEFGDSSFDGYFWCWIWVWHFGLHDFKLDFKHEFKATAKANTYVIWMLHDWFIDVACCYIILHSFYMSMNINM